MSIKDQDYRLGLAEGGSWPNVCDECGGYGLAYETKLRRQRDALADALREIIHAYDDHATDGYFDPDRGMVQPDIDRTMEQGRKALVALEEDENNG